MRREPLDLTGHFWRPEDEEEKRERWAGRVVEDPVRGVTVTASAPDQVELVMDAGAVIPIVWGRSVDRFITMTDVRLNAAATMPGGASLTLTPHRTFVCRRAFESADDVQLKLLVLHVEGLDVWAGRSGFGRQWPASLDSFTLKYERPKPIALGTIDGIEIDVNFWISTSPQGEPVVEWKLQQQAVLRFQSEEPMPYETLEPLAQHVRNFVMFAARQALDVLGVRGYIDPVDGDMRSYRDGHLEEVEIVSRYFRPRDPIQSPPTRREEFMFGAGASASNQTPLEHWVALQDEDELGPVFNLYLSALYQPSAFVEYTFLALSQAIETLNARRYGTSEDTYLVAVTNALSRLPPGVRSLIPDAALLAQSVKTSRHYHTHWNPKLRSKAKTTLTELAGLTRVLRCVLEALLLVELGFTGEEADRLLEKNLRYPRDLTRGLMGAGL